MISDDARRFYKAALGASKLVSQWPLWKQDGLAITRSLEGIEMIKKDMEHARLSRPSKLSRLELTAIIKNLEQNINTLNAMWDHLEERLDKLEGR